MPAPPEAPSVRGIRERAPGKRHYQYTCCEYEPVFVWGFKDKGKLACGMYANDNVCSEWPRNTSIPAITQGGTNAGDHPPITPCAPASESELGGDSWRLYDYVVRHFLGWVLTSISCFFSVAQALKPSFPVNLTRNLSFLLQAVNLVLLQLSLVYGQLSHAHFSVKLP